MKLNQRKNMMNKKLEVISCSRGNQFKSLYTMSCDKIKLDYNSTNTFKLCRLCFYIELKIKLKHSILNKRIK